MPDNLDDDFGPGPYPALADPAPPSPPGQQTAIRAPSPQRKRRRDRASSESGNVPHGKKRRRLHAAMHARRNGEQTRSINTLSERDRQKAGEPAAVIGRRAGAGTGMPTEMGGRESDSSSDVVKANLPETQRHPPGGRTPPDRAHAPPTRAHAGRRIHAAMHARRNGEHTRSINVLRERDRQLAGEIATLPGRSAWGVDPQSLGVVIETRRVLVSDGRIFQDR